MSGIALDLSATPLDVGLWCLRADLQYSRIPSHRRPALVEAALEDGSTLARSAAASWGQDPARIAERCDVAVIHSEREAGFGSVVVHAEYLERPPRITLYVPAIGRLDAAIAASNAAILRGFGTAMPVFLAHELYHHFDCLRGNRRLSRRHAIALFGLGRWQWTSGLSSLPEIAAGAFAQHLLALPFHPGLLDLLVASKKEISTDRVEPAQA